MNGTTGSRIKEIRQQVTNSQKHNTCPNIKLQQTTPSPPSSTPCNPNPNKTADSNPHPQPSASYTAPSSPTIILHWSPTTTSRTIHIIQMHTEGIRSSGWAIVPLAIRLEVSRRDISRPRTTALRRLLYLFNLDLE